MTLGEMCQELNDRYRTRKMPAERHIQQLIDKVSTREEAELAAGAIARFHAERVSLRASGANLRRRGTLDGRSLLMFIDACQRGGNVDAAVDAAEKHLVMGLTITRRGLEALLDACITVEQIMRAYALWRKVDIPVDARCATAVVSAAARVGDADAAAAFAAQFTDAGTPPSLEALVAVASAALDRADVALATEAVASARAAVVRQKANASDGEDETNAERAEAMAALCAAQANALAGRDAAAAEELAAAVAVAGERMRRSRRRFARGSRSGRDVYTGVRARTRWWRRRRRRWRRRRRGRWPRGSRRRRRGAVSSLTSRGRLTGSTSAARRWRRARRRRARATRVPTRVSTRRRADGIPNESGAHERIAVVVAAARLIAEVSPRAVDGASVASHLLKLLGGGESVDAGDSGA